MFKTQIIQDQKKQKDRQEGGQNLRNKKDGQTRKERKKERNSMEDLPN